MAEQTSLIIATIIHFIFRVTIFLDVNKELCGSMLGISSILVFFSIYMFLSDTQLLPEKYKKLSKVMSTLIESIICLFLIELSVVLIWSKIETGIEYMFKTILMENDLHLYEEMGGDNLVGFIVILLSAAFMFYASIVTNCLEKAVILSLTIRESAEKYLEQAAEKRKTLKSTQKLAKSEEVAHRQTTSPADIIQSLTNMNCTCQIIPANGKTHSKKVNFRIEPIDD